MFGFDLDISKRQWLSSPPAIQNATRPRRSRPIRACAFGGSIHAVHASPPSAIPARRRLERGDLFEQMLGMGRPGENRGGLSHFWGSIGSGVAALTVNQFPSDEPFDSAEPHGESRETPRTTASARAPRSLKTWMRVTGHFVAVGLRMSTIRRAAHRGPRSPGERQW
jgi:hypothetical protein